MITLIIPAYNAGKTIARAVESAIGQSCHDIEILIIDDGSTDDTGALADKYAAMDERVRAIHIEKQSVGHARNLGVAKALGEYIGFLDADDYMHPELVERLYGAIVRDHSEMAVCAWAYVDEDGGHLPWRTPTLKSCVMSSEEAQRVFLESNNIEGFCWNKLIKKELYLKNDTKYDENVISFCDILANYRLLKCADKISYVGEQLYDYYQMPGSTIRSINLAKSYDFLSVACEVKNEAEDAGLGASGKKYMVYRLYRHLYGLYKERNAYDRRELIKYYRETYKKYLRISAFRMALTALSYEYDNPLKYIVKVILVKAYYYRIGITKL